MDHFAFLIYLAVCVYRGQLDQGSKLWTPEGFCIHVHFHVPR